MIKETKAIYKPSKKSAIEAMLLIDKLPNDCALEDIQYHLFVLQKIQRALKDVENGRVHTQKEVERKKNDS